MLYPVLSKKILDAVFEVHRSLGPGLLEKCYHNALFYELRHLGLGVDYNAQFKVMHRGQVVGEYYADIIVDNKVVLELKSVEHFSPAHGMQLLNYLHITTCRLGFLINFLKPRLEFKRMIL